MYCKKKDHQREVIDKEIKIMRLIDRRIRFERYKPYAFVGVYCILIILLIWSLI